MWMYVGFVGVWTVVIAVTVLLTGSAGLHPASFSSAVAATFEVVGVTKKVVHAIVGEGAINFFASEAEVLVRVPRAIRRRRVGHLRLVSPPRAHAL